MSKLINLNLLEVIQILWKNQEMKAVSDKGEIKWISTTLDNQSKDKVKDLLYININGFKHHILRDVVFESLNCDMWAIESNEK